MYSYTVNVLPDHPDETKTFTINSPHKLDKRILQIVGLYLDDGMTNCGLKEILTTAEMYVEVIGETKNKIGYIKYLIKKTKHATISRRRKNFKRSFISTT